MVYKNDSVAFRQVGMPLEGGAGIEIYADEEEFNDYLHDKVEVEDFLKEFYKKIDKSKDIGYRTGWLCRCGKVCDSEVRGIDTSDPCPACACPMWTESQSDKDKDKDRERSRRIGKYEKRLPFPGT